MDIEGGMDLNFKREMQYRVQILKVLLHTPPPWEKESFIRIVGTSISKIVVLSILKTGL